MTVTINRDKVKAAKAAAAATAHAKFERRGQLAEALYVTSPNRASASHYDRRCARFSSAGDAEGVRNARAEQVQMQELTRKAPPLAAALDTVFTVQHEYDHLPRSAEHKEAIRVMTREKLRLKHGDSSVRDQVLQDYVRATQVIAGAVPTFAQRMSDTGSEFDIRNVEALAPFGARLGEAEEQARQK